jgi:two-component system LytT family sensor kinase
MSAGLWAGRKLSSPTRRERRDVHHSGIVNDWLLVSQVIGYTVSTVIVILLGVLVRRAARLDHPSAYGLLLWSVLLWNAGNLIASAGVLAGQSAAGPLVRVVMAVAFSGAALGPAGALIMWRRLDGRSVTSSAGGEALATWLVRASIAVGITLTLLMWDQVLRGAALVSEHTLWPLLAYHVAAFFVAGALVFYKRHAATLATRVAIGMTGLGALGVGLSVLLKPESQLGAAVLLELFRQVATHVMTLGALFFFARFRFADVFVRGSLRMTAAALVSLLCVAVLAASPTAIGGAASTQPSAVALAIGVVTVAVLILMFPLVDRVIVALVDRWLFEQPDYDSALRKLRDDLAGEREDTALNRVALRSACETLALQDARIEPNTGPASVKQDALTTGNAIGDADTGSQTSDGSCGFVVPIPVGGTVTEVLAVTSRPDRPTLLAREAEFLRAAAMALGHRLDVVHREREQVDRRAREADLRRQVSEATLRALQAQVNPHFLFNTLNTIAHLIQDDPTRA